MSDLSARALDARRFAGEMWSSAADSAERTRAQLERHPELTAIAFGVAALLLVLIGLVLGALRRSSRRHQAGHLRDDLVDAVRMGEIDPDDFRVFAMIDFCDRVARRGRRPRAGRHASSRPVLDSALASSLISAVGPGSLLPPVGPFWPYAAPEPGEVEVSDVWVRAVSFQHDLMGKRRSRTDAVEPMPTPGSGPAPRRLVSVPTPTTIDLREMPSSGGEDVAAPVKPADPVAAWAPPPASGSAEVGMDVSELGTLSVGSEAGEDVLSAESAADLGSLIEDESGQAEADAVRLLEIVPNPDVVLTEEDTGPLGPVPITGEETAACVEETETEIGTSAGDWFLEGQARPFDPLTDPLSTPTFRRGDEPSQELEPVFMAAAEAQQAAESALREHREQQRILRERVARRWEAIEQVAQEAQEAASQEIDLRALEVPRHIDLTRVEQDRSAGELEPVSARGSRATQSLQALIQRSDALIGSAQAGAGEPDLAQGARLAGGETGGAGTGSAQSGRTPTGHAGTGTSAWVTVGRSGGGSGPGPVGAGSAEAGRTSSAVSKSGAHLSASTSADRSGVVGSGSVESGRTSSGRRRTGASASAWSTAGGSEAGLGPISSGSVGIGRTSSADDETQASLSVSASRSGVVGADLVESAQTSSDLAANGPGAPALTTPGSAEPGRTEIDGGGSAGAVTGHDEVVRAQAREGEGATFGLGRNEGAEAEAGPGDPGGFGVSQGDSGGFGLSQGAGAGGGPARSSDDEADGFPSLGDGAGPGSAGAGRPGGGQAEMTHGEASGPGSAGVGWAEARGAEAESAASRSGGLGSRQAGMAKHAISGPIDLPLGLHRNRTAQAAQAMPPQAMPAGPGPQEKEEAPPTNPIPRLDLPVANQVDAREVSPAEKLLGSRPRWMTPGETPTARTEQVGGVIEPVNAGTGDDANGERMPRNGFWGRRVHRRPRTTLTEVTGHGKPPGALVPFTGQIPVQSPVQIPMQGGAAGSEEREPQDEPARG